MLPAIAPSTQADVLLKPAAIHSSKSFESIDIKGDHDEYGLLLTENASLQVLGKTEIAGTFVNSAIKAHGGSSPQSIDFQGNVDIRDLTTSTAKGNPLKLQSIQARMKSLELTNIKKVSNDGRDFALDMLSDKTDLSVQGDITVHNFYHEGQSKGMAGIGVGEHSHMDAKNIFISCVKEDENDALANGSIHGAYFYKNAESQISEDIVIKDISGHVLNDNGVLDVIGLSVIGDIEENLGVLSVHNTVSITDIKSPDTAIGLEAAESIVKIHNLTVQSIKGNEAIGLSDKDSTIEIRGNTAISDIVGDGLAVAIDTSNLRIENGLVIERISASEPAHAFAIIAEAIDQETSDGVYIGSKDDLATNRIEGNIITAVEEGDDDVIYAGKVTAVFANPSSSFKGLTLSESPSGKINLTFKNKAIWVVPDNNTLQGALTLENGAAVLLGDAASRQHRSNPIKLELKKLTGSNGIFYLQTDGDRNFSDTVVIDDATGKHGIYLLATGSEPSSQSLDYLVKIMRGDASFELINDGAKVEHGLYLWELTSKKVNNETKWFLTKVEGKEEDVIKNTAEVVHEIVPINDVKTQLAKPQYTPTAEAVLAMSGMGGQISSYLNGLSDLRKRLGEVRSDRVEVDGLWVSTSAQQEHITGFEKTRFKQKGYQINVGYDHHTNNNWLLGFNLKTSRADQKTHDRDFGAKGEVDSYGANLYASRTADNGQYIDLVVSLDKYDESISTNMLTGASIKGDYQNWMIGLSSEIGQKFQFGEGCTYFIEPQLQITYQWIQGDEFTLSNGMEIVQDNFSNVVGRVGFVAGQEFGNLSQQQGLIYVKGGMKYNFHSEQSISVNGKNFKDNLLEQRFYYGVGMDIMRKQNWRLYSYAEREEGRSYMKDFEIGFGIKYLFY